MTRSGFNNQESLSISSHNNPYFVPSPTLIPFFFSLRIRVLSYRIIALLAVCILSMMFSQNCIFNSGQKLPFRRSIFLSLVQSFLR